MKTIDLKTFTLNDARKLTHEKLNNPKTTKAFLRQMLADAYKNLGQAISFMTDEEFDRIPKEDVDPDKSHNDIGAMSFAYHSYKYAILTFEKHLTSVN